MGRARPHEVVGVVAVVEAGLGREPAVGVHAVEVQVEQLVHGQRLALRPDLAGVDLCQQLTPFPTGLGRRPVAPLGDLDPLPGQRIGAESDLEVPAATSVLVHALRLLRHTATSLRTQFRFSPVLKMFSRDASGRTTDRNKSASELHLCGALGGIRTPNLLIRSHFRPGALTRSLAQNRRSDDPFVAPWYSLQTSVQRGCVDSLWTRIGPLDGSCLRIVNTMASPLASIVREDPA